MMDKTIVEAAWNFARKQWGKQIPHTIDKIADMLIDFGNEIRTMPLRDRLTAEEKEIVRKMYKELSECIENRTADVEYLKGKRCQLAIIFGADFFKDSTNG